jgi:hypothetical protein
MQSKYGNNIECDYIKKIRVPIFDQQGNTDNGTRYYFPENPQIDNNLVVGIEAHIQPFDISTVVGGKSIIAVYAKEMYFSFYNDKKEEIFYNVPYFSLFGNPVVPYKRRIKPYSNRLNCKMCYVYVPANSTISLVGGYYAELTFFLKKPTN